MSEYNDNIEKLFGQEGMKKPPSRKELYDAIGALMEGHNKLADRVQALEGHGIKYAGVHQKALSYPRGSAVTSSGSLWIALRDTREGEQPGKVPDAWQLAAKSARPELNGRPAE